MIAFIGRSMLDLYIMCIEEKKKDRIKVIKKNKGEENQNKTEEKQKNKTEDKKITWFKEKTTTRKQGAPMKKKKFHTGNQTNAAWVKGRNPNHQTIWKTKQTMHVKQEYAVLGNTGEICDESPQSRTLGRLVSLPRHFPFVS